MPILQNSPPVHQELTKAIADAEHRGDNAEVDALLLAKAVLIRREVAMARVDRLRNELQDACADLEAALRKVDEAA